MTKRLVAIAGLTLALAACNDQYASSGRSLSPIPPKTMALMAEKGMSKNDPILVRAYKKESELEVWKKGNDGQYALLKSFPICRWSGQLGPKRREGDRQAPEGFYTVTPAQMNPNSAYYLSFDTGYPNAYDRAHDGTGSQLMVHGTCSSRGCFAMTDEGIAEVYSLAREAFASGQRGFQFQSFPFRMTAENMARHRYDQNMAFWRNLKEGADNFEVTKNEPRIAVCGGRYSFNSTGCKPSDPVVASAVAEKEREDDQQVAELVAKGTPAVKIVYEDGGQHESFREVMMASASPSASDGQFAILDSRPRRNLGDVSRPDALAAGPREIAIDASGKPVGEGKAATALAFAPSAKVGVKPFVALASATAKTEPAKPVASRVASAEPEATPAPLSSVKSLYERTMGSMFGGKEPAPAPESAAPAPAQAATMPLPPRRGAALSPSDRKAADPERRADADSPAQPLSAWSSWLSR